MTPAERNGRRRLAYHLQLAMRAAAANLMAWGKDDCALFHGNVELAARGYDPCAGFRGRYRTARGAHRVLGAGGLPGIMRKAARRHGWRKVKATKAKVGDVGLIVVGNAFAVVRCLHRGEWIGRNSAGWSMVPTSRVRLAWQVF
jgi:hypothetical protein